MFGRLYLADELRDEIIIICHGFGSSQNSSTVQLIKDWALSLNQSVITFDFSGHGNSGGDFNNLTITGSTNDANNIIDYATKQLGFKSITLIGYSYGGLIVTAAAKDRIEVTNLVLVNTLIDYHEKEILLHRAEELKKWAEEGVREYVIHDKTLKLNYAYYKDSLKYSAYDLLKDTEANVLLVHSINDEMIPYKQVLKLSNKTGIPIHTIKNAHHRFITDDAKNDLLKCLSAFLI